MFKNYFKIALRNLSKNKLYSVVNLAGLTVGICSCILIGTFILHELSYDRFHPKAGRIARVTMEYSIGGTVEKAAVTGTKVGPQFTRTFPGVEGYARFMKASRIIGYADKVMEEKRFVYADSTVFRIFSFPLIEGDPETALNAAGKIIISLSLKQKLFGNGPAMGKILRSASERRDYVISGVAENPPTNSQIQFDCLASFSSLEASRSEEWWSANDITYLLLHDGSDMGTLEKAINNYMKNQAGTLYLTAGDYLNYHLEPFTRVHLHSALDGMEPNGNIVYVYILSLIALLILCIGCVNYTNLATAQSASRNAEISIRKVMGAQRWQLFGQFIGESVLFTLISLVLAVGASVLLLPVFNRITGKELPITLLFQPIMLCWLVVLSLVVGLAAGLYPALILSNYKLIQVLKSGFAFSKSGGAFRKSLIVFQFVISIFLIISTIIILQQLSYIQKKDLGYSKDHVLVLPVDAPMRTYYDPLKSSLMLTSGVLAVSGAYESPVFIQWGDGITTGNGPGAVHLPVHAMPVDLDIVKTLGLHIIAGSDFTDADLKPQDSSQNIRNIQSRFILNEAAAKALGWKPQEAVGKTIYRNQPGIVKAVVKDFHIASLHEPIAPLLIFLDTQYVNAYFVKISGNNIPATLKGLEKTWKERVTHRPFTYHFLDDDYNALYISEQRTARVFSSFSTLAILLACLGLFALAAYSTVQRSKEIGIRKVLGASVPGIMILLSKDFLQLVMIAILIAAPAGWFAMSRWLRDFAYRINICWEVFVLGGAIAILISLITVSLQAGKAALSNPVKTLRSE